jgi:hypothetical protein
MLVKEGGIAMRTTGAERFLVVASLLLASCHRLLPFGNDRRDQRPADAPWWPDIVGPDAPAQPDRSRSDIPLAAHDAAKAQKEAGKLDTGKKLDVGKKLDGPKDLVSTACGSAASWKCVDSTGGCALNCESRVLQCSGTTSFVCTCMKSGAMCNSASYGLGGGGPTCVQSDYGPFSSVCWKALSNSLLACCLN